jgi:uncharacterized protein
MFLEIKELEAHPVDFNEKFAPGAIEFTDEVRQIEPIATSGRADLVEERHGKHEVVQDIRLKGKLSTRLELTCARCLEPVAHDVKRDFDLLYRPLGVDAGKGELSVTGVEADIGYYQGDGLELEDVVREQVLLSVPVKALCREDCKGLCSRCGQNLNEAQCSCATASADPRWTALKEIRNKIEHEGLNQ